MMAVLKSLLDNSNVFVCLELASVDSLLIEIEIFVVLGIMGDFQLYPGYFELRCEILDAF